MDGSAGPPAGYALATILQTENRQMGRALAHGRLTPPLVAHHAGQRRFARYSNRGASHERQALLVGTRAKLPAEFVRQAVANSQRAEVPLSLQLCPDGISRQETSSFTSAQWQVDRCA